MLRFLKRICFSLWLSMPPAEMPLRDISVLLLGCRFPENIGMAARACANMGCPNLVLVNPERWDFLKAEPLATPKGIPILRDIRVYDSLEEALAPFNFTVATTARLGGWRSHAQLPEEVAAGIAARMPQKTALVFGREDRGLTNAEICVCDGVTHIPCCGDASSLNLAQAVLLMLHECRRALRGAEIGKNARQTISHSELMRLEGSLQEALILLECLDGRNPDYFFRIWQGILARAQLNRAEYDALMGFCRQIRNHGR